MTVYLDVLFLMNFLMDYSIIAYTAIIQQKKIKIWRLIISAIFATLSIFLLFVINVYLFVVLRFIWSILIVLIAFGYQSSKTFLTNLVIFYILNFTIAGIIISINHSNRTIFLNGNDSVSDISWYLLIIAFILANVVLYFFKLSLRDKLEYKEMLFKIVVGNNLYQGKGLIDTGNLLTVTDEFIPVIFVDISLMDNITNDFIMKNLQFTYIKYQTVNGEKTDIAFLPNKFFVEIDGQFIERRVYIILSSNIYDKRNHFHAILHRSLSKES